MKDDTMEYLVDYKSKKYFIGAVFTNSSNLRVEVIGKCFPPEGKKYTSKYMVKFDDGSIKEVSSDMLSKGVFSYPIIFSTGNNSTNKYKTIYKRFEQMKERCNNQSNKDYIRYGGRGIKVEFENVFYFWFTLQKDPRISLLLENPSDYEIDRIDNNGNYSSENIRIATRSENQRNRRDNYVYELIDNITSEVIFSGIKADCETFLKTALGINTALDTNIYKKEVGKHQGFSISYRIIDNKY